MLLYEDIITGDEMFSDAFPVKEVDGIVYEVDCALIIIKEGAVDIELVNNVIHSFRLQPTTFDKKTYLTTLKAYMKAVKGKLSEERVADFESGAQTFAKKVVANFKDYEFYTGENMNPDGMVALLNYREDGVTPYFTFWKDGLKVVKL
ncbi:Mss4-like protein [Flagelloscypha sp. PMI_526]|nr:Mss4-like protein [Flagelloscypha sp. PMI_526]